MTLCATFEPPRTFPTQWLSTPTRTQKSIVLDAVAQRFRNTLRSSVPGMPTHIVGVPSNRSVSLSVSAPASNGGLPITRYAVHYSTDGRRTWRAALLTTNSSTTASVTGLTNGVPLFFQLAAKNAVGSSPWSSASPRVTPNGPPTTTGATTTTLPTSQVTAISAGGANACAIVISGAKCWGFDSEGGLAGTAPERVLQMCRSKSRA